MTLNWSLVAGPLLLLGVPLVLFADRNLDHHRQNMREGKEYVWQEQFQPEIGNLIYTLDQELNLSEEIVQLKDEFREGSRPNPNGVDSLEDVYKTILSEAPFTPGLREATDTIGSHSTQITKLENYYHDLETHLRFIGMLFVGAYLILFLGQFWYGSPLPEWVLLFAIVVLLASAKEGKEYIDKRKELREFSDKYESRREI